MLAVNLLGMETRGRRRRRRLERRQRYLHSVRRRAGGIRVVVLVKTVCPTYVIRWHDRAVRRRDRSVGRRIVIFHGVVRDYRSRHCCRGCCRLERGFPDLRVVATQSRRCAPQRRLRRRNAVVLRVRLVSGPSRSRLTSRVSVRRVAARMTGQQLLGLWACREVCNENRDTRNTLTQRSDLLLRTRKFIKGKLEFHAHSYAIQCYN